MKTGSNGRKWLIHGLALLFLILVTVGIAVNPGAASDENYAPGLYATVWSLVPPVVAITLALVTKEVYSALFGTKISFLSGETRRVWRKPMSFTVPDMPSDSI